MLQLIGMKKHLNKLNETPLLSGVLITLGILILIQGILVLQIQKNLNSLSSSFEETKNSFDVFQQTTASSTKESDLKLIELSDMLYEEQKISEELQDDLRKYDRNVDRLKDTVGDLEKLTTTDPELLQKYSQVYFLNEHYKPEDLTVIDEEYDFENGKQVSVHSEVWPFLEDLLEEAREDNVQLMVLSGYRSFEEQGTLKDTYTTYYGTGANRFSADQGYSEHQLGTTVDFTNNSIGQDLSRFAGTEEHAWLLKNAYKYGFTMSYPEDNQYYQFEPWHWRFVGKDLARALHRKDESFYDLEQREIDNYIIELFD